jgi:hypothetical protein
MVVDILDFLIPEDLEDSQLIGQLKIWLLTWHDILQDINRC